MKCRVRTAEDVERAYQDGRNQGIHDTIEYYLMLTLLFLADKQGWRTTRLTRFRDFFTQYAEEMGKGELTGKDIREILKNEYNVEVKLK